MKYFQQKATSRQKKNKLSKLCNTEGNWVEGANQFASMATEFFQELYKADNNLNPDALLNLLSAKVTPEMNDRLWREFTEKEISDALLQIGPLKALGVDGFPVRFYQTN